MLEFKEKEHGLKQDWNFHTISNHQLFTVLGQLNKKELMLICKSLKIHELSNKSKGDLQKIIQSDIYMYLKRSIALMNDHHIFLLSQLMTPDAGHERIILSQYIHFFTALGILYPVNFNNKDGFIIPKEIKSFLMRLFQDDFSDLYDRNNRVIELAYHYCELYGLIEYQKFLFFYQQKNPNDDALYDFKEILEMESLLNNQFECEFSFFHHKTIQNIEKFLTLMNEFKTTDYFTYKNLPTDFTMIDLQEKELIESLIIPLKNMTINQQNVLLNVTFNFLNGGNPLSLLKPYLANEMPELPYKVISKFYNRLLSEKERIRLWFLRGYRKYDLKK